MWGMPAPSIWPPAGPMGIFSSSLTPTRSYWKARLTGFENLRLLTPVMGCMGAERSGRAEPSTLARPGHFLTGGALHASVSAYRRRFPTSRYFNPEALGNWQRDSV